MKTFNKRSQAFVKMSKQNEETTASFFGDFLFKTFEDSQRAFL